MIATKRAYEPANRADGYRVLIDRLWPRGLSKTSADLDESRRAPAQPDHPDDAEPVIGSLPRRPPAADIERGRALVLEGQ